MNYITKSKAHGVYGLYFLFTLLMLSACTVRYVAEYDASITEEIIKLLKKVDMFYGELLETDVNNRGYENFKEKYIEIESDLRVLLVKNQIRALNKESTEQAKIALELWIEDKEEHKENNTVSDFIAKRHRGQFTRIFIAMAKGEKAKDISSQ